MSERINVMVPWLGQEEADAVAEVIAVGWVAQGPRVAAFEQELRRPMQAATLSPPPAARRHSTWRSSSPASARRRGRHPVLLVHRDDQRGRYVGATPSSPTSTRDRESDRRYREAVLTAATRAVIAVDQGGVPVDLDDIRALTDPLSIVVIEDAACGAGSTYKDGRSARGPRSRHGRSTRARSSRPVRAA